MLYKDSSEDDNESEEYSEDEVLPGTPGDGKCEPEDLVDVASELETIQREIIALKNDFEENELES